MATRLLTTSSNLSVSAGLWLRAEASNYPARVWSGAADDINTERTIAVTFANAGNQRNLLLWLSVNTTGSPVVTIKLQEYNGVSWDTRTTDTFTFAPASYTGYEYPTAFDLTSYAVTTAASKWRYAISCGTSGRAYLRRDSTAGNYMYFAFLDVDTSAPSSGDVIAIKQGVDLTLDQSLTLGAIGATYEISMIICDQANFLWQSSPVSTYTLTMTGKVVHGARGSFTIGTEASGVPFVLDWTNITTLTDGLFSAVTPYTATNPYTNGVGNTFKIDIHGTPDTHFANLVAAQALSGQKVVITRTDMSAYWQAGDVLGFYGKNVTSVEVVESTISTISGTTITLVGNLDNTVLAGAGVVNKTRAINNLGGWIKGKTNSGTCQLQNECYLYHVSITGCRVTSCLINLGSTATNNLPTSFQATDSRLQDLFFDCGTNQNRIFSFAWAIGLAVQNVVGWPTTYVYSSAVVLSNSYNITISGLYLKGYYDYGSVTITSCGNLTISNLVVAHNIFRYLLNVTGSAGLTMTDCLICCGHATAWANAQIGAADALFSSCSFQRGYGGIYLAGAPQAEFSNCRIGNESAFTGLDFDAMAYTANKVLLQNCLIGSGTLGTGLALGTPASYVRFGTYNQVSNDHRGFMPYGQYVSCGDGLVDTTVHTAGSVKFGIRFESSNSTNALTWTFNVPTGNIQNLTMTVAVWCKINNAAYYGGAYQNPRLTINYDNGTTAYCQAQSTTDWQLLYVTFTPTTIYGQITVTLSTMTDQTGSNAYVYFDDFAVLYPAGYKLDLGGMDLWADALPVVPPIATVLSANDVWTAATSTLTGAGTIGKLLTDDVDAKISTRSTHSAADVWAVGSRTLTSFGTLVSDVVTAVWSAVSRTLTSSSAPSAADNAAAVWDSDVSGLITANSIGKLLTDDIDAQISTRSSHDVADIWDALTAGLSTLNSVGKLIVDTLDATISSRSSHSAADVWTVLVRTLTSSAAPSADDIADAVWDELLVGHATPDSAGVWLEGAGSAGDPWLTHLPGAYVAGQAGYLIGNMPAGVWDEPLAGHNGAGTAGAKLLAACECFDVEEPIEDIAVESDTGCDHDLWEPAYEYATESVTDSGVDDSLSNDLWEPTSDYAGSGGYVNIADSELDDNDLLGSTVTEDSGSIPSEEGNDLWE